MNYTLRNLHEFCYEIYDGLEVYKDYKEERYAKKLYKRILLLSDDIINLLEINEKNANKATIPCLMRVIIEAACDLQNLEMFNRYSTDNDYGYEDLLDLYSYNEEKKFIEYSQDDFTEMIDWSFDKENVLEAKNKFSDMKEIVKEIGGVNIERINVFLKFRILNRNTVNSKRYRKYKIFYDICCAHTHHNLNFLSKNGLKDASDFNWLEEEYKDLLASILKNGLVNYSKILEDYINDGDLKTLRKYKKKIANSEFYAGW